MNFPQTAVLSALLFAVAAFAADPPAAASKKRALATVERQAKTDFDGMFEIRRLRVLVPYSRTLYYNDKGHERGLTAEAVREFERYLNKKYAKELRNRPLTVVIIPATRDKLLTKVADGYGDIAAGDITVTEERKKIVDFVLPSEKLVMNEVVVTGPKSPAIASTDDLAGKTVHVRKSTSYYESLTLLNERFKKEGKPAVKLVLVPDALEDEDMMEMLNAGLMQAIVVDDIIAKMWVQILPNVKINEGAVVRSAGQPGWAIRKNSPQLTELLTEFFKKSVTQTYSAAARIARQYKRIKQIRDPSADQAAQRFKDTLALFEKYGTKYGFDPLMLAAQGFQESQLDQNAKSHVGAIGVMQIMPATGAGLKVGDITQIEANIHAGAKYMDQLMTTYLSNATFDELNRTLFAFAAYNAGPGRIIQMRAEAEKRGLDREQWFNSVEIVTAEKIGIETTTYVRNIYKYYAAYKLMLDVEAEKRKALDAVKK